MNYRILLLSLSLVSPLMAVESGDVVILKSDASLKLSGQQVGKVKAGDIRKVRSVRGAWADIGEPKPGWVRVDNLLAGDAALARVNELLESTDDRASLLVSRARIEMMLGDSSSAGTDLLEAIRLDDRNAQAYFQLGKLVLAQNDFGDARNYFDQAIEHKNDESEFYRYRAIALHELGDIPGTMLNLAKAADLESLDSNLLNMLAWYYATHPDSSQRDGAAAVKHATKACEQTNYKNFAIVDTLAAAYAESGDFTNAVKWQEEAVELSAETSYKIQAKQRLDDYRLNRPFRETSRPLPDLRKRLEH